MAELQKAEISERIKQARKEAGLTQPEMAQLLDVGARAYQNYESDRVPWELMGRVSDVTGRSLRWLLHGEDDGEPSMQVMLKLSEVDRKLDQLLDRTDSPADAVTDLADAVDPPPPPPDDETGEPQT